MNNLSSLVEVSGVILSILGSLAIFLYGMKTMSEAIQRLAGSHLSDMVSKLAPNKVKGLFSGFWITGAVQSSTAITVMLVSFINAGVLTLEQSLPILLGTNLGTTITAWLIALVGFNANTLLLLLPVMAFTLPLMFHRNMQYRYIAKLINGFVLTFIGFYFLRESLPSLNISSGFVTTIFGMSEDSLSSNLLYAVFGIILILVLRSSSATIALTMVMCYNGWMSFENAVAMIVGENIGSTLTTNLAARIATNPAKRLALAHTLFNVIGAIWVFIFFNFLVHISSELTSILTGRLPTVDHLVTPFGLALFHTGFKVVNLLLFIFLLKWFNRLLEALIPVVPNEVKKSSLKYIDHGYLSMGEMSLIQVQRELLHYGQHVATMFSLIPRYLMEKRDKKFLKLQKKLYKYEDIADQREVLISNYLTKLTESGLTETSSRKVRSMVKIIDDLESIADQCLLLEKTIRLKNEANAWLTQQMRDEVFKLFDLVKEAIDNMNYNLANDYRAGVLLYATELEHKINISRDSFININKKNIEEGQYPSKNGALFADLANQCEKIGDHIINVNQAIASNIKS